MNYFFSIFWLCFFYIPLTLSAETLLWEDDVVRLYEDGGMIRLSPTVKACRISDLPEDTFVVMEQTIGKMESVFKEVFGRGDYVRSMPLLDKGGMRATIIPACAYQHEEVIDLRLKVHILLSQFFDNKQYLPPLSIDEISRIANAAKRVMSCKSSQGSVLLDKGVIPYANIKETKELLRNTLMELGEQVPVELLLENPHRIHFTTPSECVFCLGEEYEKQVIYKSSLNAVVPNRSPYVDKFDRSMMIIPNHHISTISEQTEEEIRDFFRLVVKLDHITSTYLNARDHSKETGIVITRNGWFGGQTVPHLHHHVVFYTPNTPQKWMRDFLYSISIKGWSSQKISNEEYDKMRSEISSLL